MNKQQSSDSPEAVCRVCGKEIPRSAKQTEEGKEYAHYFCGSGCAQQEAQGRPNPRDVEREG